MPTPPDNALLSRRSFLTHAGAGAALLAGLPLTAERVHPGQTGARDTPATSRAPKRYPIGIELYAVRNELTRDLPNTLRTVRQQGYEVVEFYAPYLSWTVPYAKEVRTMLDDLGLRCYSTHNGFGSLTPGDTMTKAIEINQILGSRSIVLAAPPFARGSADEWMQFSAKLAAASEQLRPHGLAAGFHNHDAEWAALPDGRRVMDIIATNTPSDFVLQLDVGTCVKAGADPVAWVNAHPGRIRSVHLKDWAPGEAAQEKEFRVLFGEGVTPWARLLGALEATGGVEFYLMEQEGSRFSEFETAQRCLANWKRLRRQQ
jgi:sugar phosphate isomerase/epimerase